MILGHSIAIEPTTAQAAHFRRACGTARYAYNWGLAEWRRAYQAGEKPNAAKLKRSWNGHRKSLPWTFEVTKCASGQAIMDLGAAFANFFRDLKKPKSERRARYPRFKSKRSDNGFALWNDQFAIDGSRIRIPLLGWVRMREPLRLDGKILGARISRIGHRWHVSVQVDVGDAQLAPATGQVVGIDLGISSLMVLSRPLPDGRAVITNSRARRALLGRQRKIQRRISRQELVRRRASAKTSRRQSIRQNRLKRLHRRIADIRKDAIHKATTAIASAFSTIVLENLNVAGMTKNHSLAGAVLDASFREIRRQSEYKAAMRGGRVVVADRWFPSSKTCSGCGHVMGSLPLSVREWVCPSCGAVHDRDANAAINLEFLVGPAWPEPLPDDLATTRGEIAALAVACATVKPWSVNRELNRHAHTCTT